MDSLTHNVSTCILIITSCPLTQLAVVFSAIIHDVDHPGVPNAQLVKEKSMLAQSYNNASVAEQNRQVNVCTKERAKNKLKRCRYLIQHSFFHGNFRKQCGFGSETLG
jgi:hypothetical protein